MPDRRSHRGPDPRDASLFAETHHAALRKAVAELSWLLERGYAGPSCLKLVGDRHRLVERQRMAVRRCACAEPTRVARLARQHAVDALRGRAIAIDGFNLLNTIEAALGGAVVLVGRDGANRDLLGVHGTYRKVAETLPAIDLVGEFLQQAGIAPCAWYLDSPVSNSGRLAGLLRSAASARGWTWDVQLVPSPDRVLRASEVPVATADAGILDRCAAWVDLAGPIIRTRVPGAWVVDLSSGVA